MATAAVRTPAMANAAFAAATAISAGGAASAGASSAGTPAQPFFRRRKRRREETLALAGERAEPAEQRAHEPAEVGPLVDLASFVSPL